jgi:Ser/Thr protein kinase RdoA (MazF antagonist)
VAPTALADPGPHWSNGLAVSLWNWVPPAPGEPEPTEVGAALGRLHLAAAGFPGELPVLSPLREQISDGLDALEREHVLDRAVLTALRDRHAEILADLAGVTGPALVLHGDAHAGNLLRPAAAPVHTAPVHTASAHAAPAHTAPAHTASAEPGSGWLWVDLEETCRGPREFDLAVLIRGLDGAAALAAYAEVTGIELPEPAVLARFDRARELEGAVWTLGMAHQFPARYREPARALLASVLRRGPH